MNKLPSFPFYPQDFLSSLDVQMMTAEEVGAYILLLTNSWIQDNQGFLPDDDEVLRKICRIEKDRWDVVKKNVLKKFSTIEKDGVIFNKKLISLKKNYEEFKAKKVDSGKIGAEKRWENERKEIKNAINLISHKNLIPLFKEFLVVRRKKSSNTESAVRLLVESVNNMGDVQAEKAIKKSITYGWSGISPEKPEAAGKKEYDPFDGFIEGGGIRN